MPKTCYVSKKFNPTHEKIILLANEILEDFYARGFTSSLRQLYYQFVGKGWLPNEQKWYKRLGDIMADARLAGRVDWNHMEDRTRNLRGKTHWKHPAETVEAASRQFSMELWKHQPNYVEVWIEKDALLGVLEHICPEHDIPYFSCRGYTSITEVWKAGRRMSRRIEQGKTCYIIHLGDHDPSGIDMSRDIISRLRMFIEEEVPGGREKMKVRRVALNMPQITRLNLPPAPAKLTDSRAKKYIDEYGDSSWELDALDPSEIIRIVKSHILNLRDDDLWERAVAKQEKGKNSLRQIVKHWKSVQSHIEELNK
jgi:hypothetical protein